MSLNNPGKPAAISNAVDILLSAGHVSREDMDGAQSSADLAKLIDVKCIHHDDLSEDSVVLDQTMREVTIIGADEQRAVTITGGTDNGALVAKMLRETALEGDFGDDGKPVVVVDASFDRHDELRATLKAAGRDDRVVVVGGMGAVFDDPKLQDAWQARQREIDGGVAFICNEHPDDRTIAMNGPLGRTRTVHKSLSLGASTVAALASMGSITSASTDPNTGRARSQQLSAQLEAERERLATLRTRSVAMSPNFAAPYGKDLTAQDHERLAAAQAKRDRRAVKKGSK